MALKKKLQAGLTGTIGNLLEHYDSALFGLLAPFIAPLFFENQDPITALILTYAMLPLNLITRPIGALIFGWIGDTCGRKQTLFISLFGMSVVTVSIGLLPTQAEIGPIAPLFLAIARMLQGFFAAGEIVSGAIFVLEHTKEKDREFISSLYDASTIAGILIASALVTLLSCDGIVETHWRLLFYGGGVTAFFGAFLRYNTFEGNEMPKPHALPKKKIFLILKENRASLFKIVIASGFSYITYSLAFTLMNGYIPLVTSLSKSDVMKSNTWLLVVDAFLLPLFGYVANRFGKEKLMFFGALTLAFIAVPVFSLLTEASLATVIFVRLSIILCGVAFAAPYHAWALEQVPTHHKGLILSFGYTLGSQLIGSPSAAVCLWMYKTTGLHIMPGLYIAFIATIACIVVAKSIQKETYIPQKETF